MTLGAGGRGLARVDILHSRPCPTDAMEPREALRFHDKAKGAQVRLDAQGCRASRCATFHDGIVFSQRPVRPSEQVVLRVLQHEDRWCGGLRVGFTRLDPERLSAASLPPFVCPDLVEQSPTWAAVLPEGSALAGDLVRFWVDPRGRLFAKTNEGPGFLLRKDVLMGAPLWAVMDVYGTTKAIELLGETTWVPDPVRGEGDVGSGGTPMGTQSHRKMVHLFILSNPIGPGPGMRMVLEQDPSQGDGSIVPRES